MISHLDDTNWLSDFFSAPNFLHWKSIKERSAPEDIINPIYPWLDGLSIGKQTAIILPYFKNSLTYEEIVWYATTQKINSPKLRLEIEAWLGPTYLNKLDIIPLDDPDPFATCLRTKYDGLIFRFSGKDVSTNKTISKRINVFAELCKRRPLISNQPLRPIGAIRSDLETAILLQNIEAAEFFIDELKATGRLNEENLKYLDIRLKAGLGLWKEIAWDHWLIRTITDLHLPPQILDHILEALYRTYLQDFEVSGDTISLMSSFESKISQPFQRLFASRRGIKTPYVVKLFILFEVLQKYPQKKILDELFELLPINDVSTDLFREITSHKNATDASNTDASNTESVAEEAFDNGQYDRAFSFFLTETLTKRTLQRLYICVESIDTDDARTLFLEKIEQAEPTFLKTINDDIYKNINNLRANTENNLQQRIKVIKVSGWMDWAETLKQGKDLLEASNSLESNFTWDIECFTKNKENSQQFADILANLSGEASFIGRRAVPNLYKTLFTVSQNINKNLKPIFDILPYLIASNDSVSGQDLELLSMVISLMLDNGISIDDYLLIIDDLYDIQKRVGSYTHLAWSLDVCEAFAIAPTPSDEGRAKRLQFFSLLIDQIENFSHRLTKQDKVLIQYLCKDFGIDPDNIGALKSTELDSPGLETFDLSGKYIGIYTLTQAAGVRAQSTIERIWPGVRIEVNSDTVATSKLTNLAKNSDIFIFAWKSSSHQAFYCVKAAVGDRDIIMPTGKGTASILSALQNNLRLKSN